MILDQEHVSFSSNFKQRSAPPQSGDPSVSGSPSLMGA